LSPGHDDVIFMVLPQTGWLETVMTVSLRKEIYLVYLFKKKKIKKKKCTVFKTKIICFILSDTKTGVSKSFSEAGDNLDY